MARYTHGPNGPFTGKLGNVVGTSWHGEPVLRSLPSKRTKPAVGDERQNQGKFAMAHYWLQPLLDFVREGFKNYSFRARGFNAAKSYLLHNAIEGEHPNISINPALVKLSAGDLPLPFDIAAAKTTETHGKGNGVIEFTWDKNSPGDPYDQVMVAAYDIENKTAAHIITGQFRNTGSHKLTVHAGKTYHLYLAFTAADRSRQSDSVYLGEITM